MGPNLHLKRSVSGDSTHNPYEQSEEPTLHSAYEESQLLASERRKEDPPPHKSMKIPLPIPPKGDMINLENADQPLNQTSEEWFNS